jgi:3-phosphoshikimate 1-carboxyvinyltransferase
MLGDFCFEGETVIHGLLLGEDPRSTAEQGFRSKWGRRISEPTVEEVRVQGIGLGLTCKNLKMSWNTGNSGTTSTRLDARDEASHPGKFFMVTGDRSIWIRPMSCVVASLQQMGVQIWGAQTTICWQPLAIQGQNSQNRIHYQSPIALPKPNRVHLC